MPFTLPIRTLLLLCLREPRRTSWQMDCAELLLAAGLTDEARLLYEAVFIQTGFSSDHIQTQREIAARTKLWDDVVWGDQTADNVIWGDAETAEPRGDEIASLQMRRLVALRAAAGPALAGSAGHAAVPSNGLAEILTRFCTALRKPPDRDTSCEIAALLAWVRLHVTGKDAFVFDGRVGAGLPVLLAGLARNVLRAFILSHLDLIEGAAGSPAVFHEAARLQTAGLGPYLTGAMAVAAGHGAGPSAIRRLLYDEGGRGSTTADLVQRGIVLSLGLHGVALMDLVDALADAGGMLAIRAIFARAQAAGAAHQDLALLQHIGAAGLRGEDFDLALQAQKIVVQAQPGSAGDWITLGDMQAAAGNRSASEAAYAKSLRMQPGYPVAIQRLDALRVGRIPRFVTVDKQVYGTYGNDMMQRRPAGSGIVLERILRRSMYRLALAPAIIQDQIDCAEMAYAAGYPGAARTLYDVIFIVSGFSPAAIERQRNVEQRLELWQPPEKMIGIGVPKRAAASSSIKLAIEQLAAIIADAGRTLQPISQPQTRMMRTRPIPERARDNGAQPSQFDLPVFCVQLKLALRQPLSSQSSVNLRAALTWLERHVLARPPIPADIYCKLDVQALADALAFDILRDFAFGIKDLAYGPYGSAELFHAAARLTEAGLGPFFSQSADLFADPRDLFGFIQLVVGKTPNIESRKEALERWSVLLSTGFGADALHRLVDELADLGLLRAILAICDRASQQSAERFDPDVMWSIRDAGLDNADFHLASQAQQVVVDRRPDDVTEWIVLGEIEATADDPKAAARAFSRAVELDPANRNALERLDALENGRFERFRIAGGYGTPEARKRLRQGRLRAA